MLASLTLLPAMLSRIGRGVDRWRVPGLGRARPEGTGFWFAWSRFIQHRPWQTAIAGARI